MTFEEIKALDAGSVMQTYGRAQVAFTHGKGCKLYDTQGKEYLDLGAGIGVNCLGHGDLAWAAAVAKQAACAAHLSNLYYNEGSTTLAARLADLSGLGGRVFLANSGAEANEGAIMLARKYSFDRYGTGRNIILTLQGSFHGRTVTTLSATGQEAFHNYFFPFTDGFAYVVPGDLAAMEDAMDGGVCGVLLETIQGESGVLPLSPDYLRQVRQLCADRDILLMVDEVQTGIGRTGSLFAYQQAGITPDVVTAAKGLGGGLPIGAVIAAAPVAHVLGAGTHGSTFGGNLVACAGAHVVLDRVTDPAFLAEVTRKGRRLREGLADIPGLTAVRGQGLMIGADLEELAVGPVVSRLLEHGVVALTAKTALRLLPPLIITDEEIDHALAVIKTVLKETV